MTCLTFASQGVTLIKPIIYGNIARYFGKKREEDGHTHQWTVYVKPYRNEVSAPYKLSPGHGIKTQHVRTCWSLSA